MMPSHLRRLSIYAAAAAAAAALSFVALGTGLLDRLESASLDTRFDIRGSQGPPKDVVVIGLSRADFARYGRQSSFPRSVHARAISALAAARPRVIAYDYEFVAKGASARDDFALYNSVASARRSRVVLAETEPPADAPTAVFGSPGAVRDSGAAVGNASIPVDPDGVVRRYDYRVRGQLTFSVVAVQRAQGRPVSPKPFRPDGILIDFAGPPATVRTFNLGDLLGGKVPNAALRDKIVVVGSEIPTDQDLHQTSVGGLMYGPEIQATAIDTILRGVPLRDAPDALTVVLILLAASLVPAAGLRWRARVTLPAGLLLLICYLAIAQLAFDGGTVLNVADTSLALMAGTIATFGVYYLTEIALRRRTRAAFARFVPDDVVAELLDQTGGESRIEGVERDATVLFCDLRDFTALSEPLRAEQVLELLNRYLDQMSSAVLRHGGTVVSYMGDGIMAVFGAPVPQPDHATRALAAALDMAGPCRESFGRWLADAGHGGDVRVGIGINSGTVMSGTVGSNKRLEYAAVGDTTNTAARLESIAADEGRAIVMSQATVDRLASVPDGLVELGDRELRGRDLPVRIWSADSLLS